MSIKSRLDRLENKIGKHMVIYVDLEEGEDTDEAVARKLKEEGLSEDDDYLAYVYVDESV